MERRAEAARAGRRSAGGRGPSPLVAGETRRRARGRPLLGAARVLAVERDPRVSRRRVRAVRPRRRGGGGLRARGHGRAPRSRWPRSSSRRRWSPRPRSRSRCSRRAGSWPPSPRGWPSSPSSSSRWPWPARWARRSPTSCPSSTRSACPAGTRTRGGCSARRCPAKRTSVPYVRIDAVPFPVRAAGVVAFAAAAFVIGRALARARGTAATVAATGRAVRRLRRPRRRRARQSPPPARAAVCSAGGDDGDRLAMAGLGVRPRLRAQHPPARAARTAGRAALRALEKAGGLIERIRFGAGFDLTLALAAAHVAALGILLARAAPALGASDDGSQVDDQTAVDKLDERVKYDLQ